MLVYIIFIFSIYFGFLLLCIAGWLKFTHPAKSTELTEQHFVSVIVAFRNEQNSITHLLESLSIQDFPLSHFEVILVDDHSTDQTTRMINEWKSRNPKLTCNYFHADTNGKKNALTKAIQNAKGDIILTTDADCVLPIKWISQLVWSFTPETAMVTGLVKVKEGNSLFSKIQALEFTSLVGSGIAMLKQGFPIMCNGASLAFRKNEFMAVGGYEGNFHIPSGDDEFLMRKLNKKFPGSIRSIRFPCEAVMTEPQPSLKSFIHQRLRWAGKWKGNDSFIAKGIAFFVLLFQSTVLITFCLALVGEYQKVAALLLGIKMLMEGYLLVKVSKSINQPFSLAAFFILQFAYPFYVLIIGILSQFIDYEWKGRKVSALG